MELFFLGMREVVSNALPILALVALGLTLGQQDKRTLIFALPTFLVLSLVGLELGRQRVLPALPISTLLLSVAALVGLSAVLRLKLPLILAVLLSAITGLLLGLLIKPLILPGYTAFKVYSVFAGIGITATVLLGLVTFISVGLQRFWNGVLVRAMASWVVASTLMVLVLIATKTLPS